jgi:hypothetical protein
MPSPSNGWTHAAGLVAEDDEERVVGFELDRRGFWCWHGGGGAHVDGGYSGGFGAFLVDGEESFVNDGADGERLLLGDAGKIGGVAECEAQAERL